MAPVQRSWFAFLIDRLAGLYLRLPPESCSYTTLPLRIPIGPANLAANLYQPSTPKPLGTILVRTSYGISPWMAITNARIFASRGYVVLLAACRGTDPSDGQEIVMGANEAADGLATVDWMRKQEWYTGGFATIGGSYLGYTQWAILSDQPPDMKAAVVMTGPADFGDFAWRTGALESHFVAWADLMTAGKRGLKIGPGYIKKQREVLRPVYDSVPLVDGIEKHLGEHTPDWLRTMVAHPDRSDPLFDAINQSGGLKRAEIPILQITGWNDVGLPAIMEQHEALAGRKATAKTFLTIGPWSHLGAQRGPALVEGLQFLDTYLAGRGDGFRTSSVRAFVTGKKQWQEMPSWPPAAASTRDLYLGPSQTLLFAEQQTAKTTSSSTFTFDPEDPTPNIGIPRPFDDIAPASYDDTSLASRGDVAVFTSQPLDADLEVLGRPVVEVSHASDNPNVDVLVQLSEVNGRGKSTRVGEVYRRLNPPDGTTTEGVDGTATKGLDGTAAEEERVLKLTLSDCAHVFPRGARIRVVVAGGAHPAYIRNLGTGENPATGSGVRRARHRVYHHSGGRVSRVVLPVRE